MIYRAVLILLTFFWVTMNVLLWRSEYGGHNSAGSAVPAEVIWQKILTAPDSSSLSVFHHRKKAGFCHWITSVGEDLVKAQEEDAPPEGMVGSVVGYRVQLDGNLVIPDVASRLRFDASLRLNRDKLWRQFNLRLNLRPGNWEIQATAADQTVRFKAEEGDASFDHVFKFSELTNPAELARQFGDPLALGLLSSLGLSSQIPAGPPVGFDLKWEGRHDSVQIAHSAVRAYRLEARVLDRYRIVIFVSRVGEILRVELPDEVVLVNDQLANY
jgi:hypothetical protein